MAQNHAYKYIPSVGTQRIHVSFNIMNNVTLVFCTIHVTIHISLKRKATVANGSPDLHTCWQLYNSLNALSMIFQILFVSIAMTVKYRLT